MGWRKYLVGSLLALMPCVVSANSLGNSDYTAAYEAYNRAKTATSLKVSTDAYADAISLVAKAVTKEPAHHTRKITSCKPKKSFALK